MRLCRIKFFCSSRLIFYSSGVSLSCFFRLAYETNHINIRVGTSTQALKKNIFPKNSIIFWVPCFYYWILNIFLPKRRHYRFYQSCACAVWLKIQSPFTDIQGKGRLFFTEMYNTSIPGHCWIAEAFNTEMFTYWVQYKISTARDIFSFIVNTCVHLFLVKKCTISFSKKTQCSCDWYRNLHLDSNFERSGSGGNWIFQTDLKNWIFRLKCIWTENVDNFNIWTGE